MIELTVDMTAEGGLVMMEMAGLRWSDMIIWSAIQLLITGFTCGMSLTVATTFVKRLKKYFKDSGQGL